MPPWRKVTTKPASFGRAWSARSSTWPRAGIDQVRRGSAQTWALAQMQPASARTVSGRAASIDTGAVARGPGEIEAPQPSDPMATAAATAAMAFMLVT